MAWLSNFEGLLERCYKISVKQRRLEMKVTFESPPVNGDPAISLLDTLDFGGKALALSRPTSSYSFSISTSF